MARYEDQDDEFDGLASATGIIHAMIGTVIVGTIAVVVYLFPSFL